jgi:heme/copper-type cytochrome/quinol oxidase subunit 3
MCPGEGLYVPDPCELTFANTLLLSNAAVSLGGAVVSLESSGSFSILFSLFSGILAWAFISLQIKEFRVMGFSINDSVYSSVFSLLTGLHFFHLVVGLFLLSLYYCSCSFHCKIDNLVCMVPKGARVVIMFLLVLYIVDSYSSFIGFTITKCKLIFLKL